MAAWGIAREDIECENVAIDVWPENWTPYEVFRKMQSQWDVGPMGPTSLKYEVAISLMKDVLGVKKKDRRDVLAALQIMEGAALKEMSKK